MQNHESFTLQQGCPGLARKEAELAWGRRPGLPDWDLAARLEKVFGVCEALGTEGPGTRGIAKVKLTMEDDRRCAMRQGIGSSSTGFAQSSIDSKFNGKEGCREWIAAALET